MLDDHRNSHYVDHNETGVKQMQVRSINANDKTLIALELLNAGVSARIRMIRNGMRIVFVGNWETVANVLNSNGYTFFGKPVDRFAFNSIDPTHGEIFIRHAFA